MYIYIYIYTYIFICMSSLRRLFLVETIMYEPLCKPAAHRAADVYIYIYACLCIYTYTYIHIYLHVCPPFAGCFLWKRLCTSRSVTSCAPSSRCIYIYAYICIYIHIHLYIYIYMYVLPPQAVSCGNDYVRAAL